MLGTDKGDNHQSDRGDESDSSDREPEKSLMQVNFLLLR